MASVVLYSTEYQLQICLQHRHAIRDLQRHLREEHLELSLIQRQEILSQHAEDECISPQLFQPPQQAIEALPYLQPPITVLQCTELGCQRRVVSEIQMATHCNKQHNWRKSVDAPVHWTRIRAQTFFTGALTKYFPVRESALAASELEQVGSATASVAISSNQTSSVTLTVQQQGDVERILQLRREATELYIQKTEEAEKDIQKEDRTGWFTRTGWPQHFAGRNIIQIAHCSRLPDKTEPVLTAVVSDFDTVWQDAVTGLSSLDHETRRWLRSAKATEPDVRPLARLQTDNALERYASYFRRLLCYTLRLWVAEEEEKDPSLAVVSTTTVRRRRTVISDSESTSATSGDSVPHPNQPTSNPSATLTDDARQIFPWQSGLRESLAELYRGITDPRRESQSHLIHALLVSLIATNIGTDPYSSILVHFAAVLGIDTENRRFRRAEDYSYILAGLVYGIRILTVDYFIPSWDRNDFPRQNQLRRQFLRIRTQFLVDGSFSPASTLLSLLAYSKHIALQIGNRGRVSWTPDRQTVFYCGHPISVNAFRMMVADALQRAEDLFWSQLMWVDDIAQRFEVKLQSLVDDMTIGERGYSFIFRQSNQLPDGFEWMIRRMSQLPTATQLRRGGQWRPTRVRRYLRSVQQFWRLLLFCIHVIGGMPARGTEILSILFRNGLYQDRNLYLIDGCIVVVTRYHKSQSLMDQVKVVPRRLTPRLSQLVTLYLVYVRPFQEHLREEVLRESRSDYLWSTETGHWGTEQLTTVLQQETLTWLGRSCNTLDYRHLAITLGREVSGSLFTEGADDEGPESEELQQDEDLFELQSGHNTATGYRRYGVSLDIVRDLSAQSISTFRLVSEKWHQFLHLREKATAVVKPYSERALVSNQQLARGHKRELSQETQQNTVRRPPPVTIGTAISNRSSLQSRSVEATVPFRLAPVSPHSERVRAAMRQLFSHSCDSDRFTSLAQQQGIEAVLNGEHPIAVILPTGGGKTLLPMVAALLDPEGVFILITPLRALTQDMVTRFRRASIRCHEWQDGSRETPTVLIVSADIAASYRFLTFAQQLQQQGRLRRVFIDEAHLTLTASPWRPRLDQLQCLRVLTCPLILLTATLPPLLELAFEQGLGLRQMRYIRTSTVRPHHRYYIQHCDTDDLDSESQNLCRRWQQRIRTQKGIVYCRTRDQCDNLAQTLSCYSYHAQRLDRESQLTAWCSNGGLIVATSALGTGINIPAVVVIIHIDLPWSMIDFAQESGRGGREGVPVDSIVLVDTYQVQRQQTEGRYQIDQAAVADFVTTRDCRRWVMSEYLDGVGQGRRCRDLGEYGCCDRCGDGTSIRLQRSRAQGQLRAYVHQVLDELSSGCALCWFFQGLGDASRFGHSTRACQAWGHDYSAPELDKFRGRIRYDRQSHSCHRCGIDQRWCASGHDAPQPCQWPFVFVPVVRGIPRRPRLRPLLQRLGYGGNVEDVEDAQYGRWLGQLHQHRVCGLWMSNGMAALVAVISLGRRGIGQADVTAADPLE